MCLLGVRTATPSYSVIPASSSPSFVSQINSFGLTDVGVSAAPSFADIDGDGDLDAFVGEASGSFVFFRNTGTALAPSFISQANNFGLFKEPNFVRPAFADIDADGDLDAFVGSGDGTPLFFRNVGTANAPSFVKQSTNLGLTSAGPSATPSFADLDGDGDLDSVIGKDNGETLYFRNIGNATNPNFSAVGTNVFGLSVSGNRYTQPAFADLDGDG
ncbi:MAG: VCBS repeat-containing protein, partial [Methylococcaceae bacterium]|nr:VCBS repeat-containing protein [Methylococcaceae bacterium]